MTQVQSSTGRWYTPQPFGVRCLNRLRILFSKPSGRSYGAYRAEPERFGRVRSMLAGLRLNAARARHPRDVELHAPLRRHGG